MPFSYIQVPQRVMAVSSYQSPHRGDDVVFEPHHFAVFQYEPAPTPVTEPCTWSTGTPLWYVDFVTVGCVDRALPWHVSERTLLLQPTFALRLVPELNPSSI